MQCTTVSFHSGRKYEVKKIPRQGHVKLEVEKWEARKKNKKLGHRLPETYNSESPYTDRV